jgi:hypothetical protein
MVFFTVGHLLATQRFQRSTLVMSTRIDTVTARAKLPILPDPYWQRIRTGLYLGYRKASGDTEGTGLARYRSKTTGQQWHALGHLSDSLPHARLDRALAETNRQPTRQLALR